MAEASKSGCPDLEAFIISKYDPLLTIVKELNESLQKLEQDNLRLERRLIKLEYYLLEMEDTGQDLPAAVPDAPAIHTIHDESGLFPPWLFSCQAGTPLSSTQALLDFAPSNTMELDVVGWLREEHMWVAFLEQLPSCFNFKYEREEVGDLQSLRRIARRALLDIMSGEILIVLRNVPGKAEATTRIASITLVAILASAISEAWRRAEFSNPQNMGRVALVLEGENIGSRLRAGTRRFKITPLN
ncbi:hypothetical protein BdWA1_002508 [Babesia duncani]|uniref:Apicomplexan specific coiled coil protein n=1 Tax=Babesia duncani TaxID=323732 RepID=A0AAD9UNH9_9APIC|nr:hypothetical protein BdWA1_002508 [Babesia duncani]